MQLIYNMTKKGIYHEYVKIYYKIYQCKYYFRVYFMKLIFIMLQLSAAWGQIV